LKEKVFTIISDSKLFSLKKALEADSTIGKIIEETRLEIYDYIRL